MIISLQACLELTETFAYPVDKKYVNTVCFRGVRKVEFDVKVYTYFKSLAWKAKKKKTCCWLLYRFRFTAALPLIDVIVL